MSTTTSKLRVALCGLGLMGGGMARRLLGAGFPLSVYNRSADKAAALAKDGARVAASPAEAAAESDVIISMVADDAASRGVWLGEKGALSRARRGAVLIESSTLTVGWVAELAAAASSRGCDLLDAPVTGSKVHAASGELNFLVGGAAATLETVRPILAVMSRSIVHLGPSGSGALVKLINNFMCGVQLASLAEAVALVERSGLDPASTMEFLTNGAAGSPLVKTLSARMMARDYTPNFKLGLMAKDLSYAIAEGGKQSLPMETVVSAFELFKRAVANGNGDQDFSALIEPFRVSRSSRS
jgi:3-hydroxyisobutyrate dehydrogenase